MTERLADINDRLNGVRQLGTVVNAMRGIAAARAREARSQLEAVDRYTASIAAAIGQALALCPPGETDRDQPATHPALVLFCAEEGFAGAFSERVLNAVQDDLGNTRLFLIGARGLASLAERRIEAGWHCSLPAHSPGIPKLADQIATAIYADIGTGRIDRLDVVFTLAAPDEAPRIERHQLFPFDRASLPTEAPTNAPLLNFAPEILLGELTADYLYAQLCHAALHAFAAENEARMTAMAAARGQIDRMLGVLQARQRQVRQEEITAEIIELAAGETASRANA